MIEQMNEECNECTIDPEQLMREQILQNMASGDFIHVIRCRDCKWYHETSVGWCNRYDEPEIANGYCDKAKRK